MLTLLLNTILLLIELILFNQPFTLRVVDFSRLWTNRQFLDDGDVAAVFVNVLNVGQVLWENSSRLGFVGGEVWLVAWFSYLETIRKINSSFAPTFTSLINGRSP